MNKYRIKLTDGAGYEGPYINKFSSGFDTVEFYVDKNFPEDCTYAVVYSVCGDVGMSTDNDDNVVVSTDVDTGKTLVIWTIGREITCHSGVVIYQVVVYSASEDGRDTAVWYSPQGRIVVGESIDTTEYETAVIAAEPSLVSQLIVKTNKFIGDVNSNITRIDVLEQLQQSMERRVDDIQSDLSKTGNSLSAHIGDEYQHVTAEEKENVARFFSLYNANGLLSITADEAEATTELLSDVIATTGDIRIAFMTGAKTFDTAPYNKLKLLSSYGICDYIVNGGGFAPDGKNMSLTEALEISKAVGAGVLNVCGDSSPKADLWANIFCGGGDSYYYIDDMKKRLRIVVLDTAHMDSAQLHWFVKEALRTDVDIPVIIFSHRNLVDFVLDSDGSSLFKRIFKAAHEGGSLVLTDDVVCDGSTVCRADVSTKFSYSVEIIATVHGNSGVDSYNNELSDNFCNIGVAEDYADGGARSLFEECDVQIHSDVSDVTDIKSVVRATVSDVILGGNRAIELIPTTDDVETYIVIDNYDIRNTEGYIVIETSIRPEGDMPDNAAFNIVTNQSRPISKRIKFSDISSTVDESGWIKIVVVICNNSDDGNFGLCNTYVNGVSYSGWHSGYLGEIMSNGAVRSEIRFVGANLTTDSRMYFGRSRVYVCHAMPTESVVADGLGEHPFCYGDKLYNTGSEQALLKELGADKGCYDVLCIDTALHSISTCRFGFGVSRKVKWTVPDIVFE